MKRGKFIKIIRFFLIIFLVASIMYITYSFWNSKIEQKETDELLNTVIVSSEAESVETQRIIEVKALQEQYPDVKAWIEIEGTNINYPVMQKEDNDFYGNHDYKGEQSKRGSIFLDKSYDWSIPSSNLLIYGHNNSKDGTMFADLLKYKDEKFYKEHPIIRFATAKEDSEYEIIAVFKSRIFYKSEKDMYRWYYFINAKNEEEYIEYINFAKRESLYDTGKTASFGEQLITLVTCEYSVEDGRLGVVARKKVYE